MEKTTKKPMTRSEMYVKIQELLEENGVTNLRKNDIVNVMNAYESIILLDLSTNLETKIGPIGKIKIKQTKERTGINPSTGERVIIPSKVQPKFSFSKGLKEYIAKHIKVN